MSAIKKILIVNRGEIACRIARTCKRLGIKTVAIYSDADRNAQHVAAADQAFYLGQPEASRSYLNQDKILEVLRESGADSVHPGYGFLSENSSFAAKVVETGAKFIGPSPQAMLALGDKLKAKNLANYAKVPVAPSIAVADVNEKKSLEQARRFAEEIGLPLMIKASGGGGGRGMRKVTAIDQIQAQLAAASREAFAFFGNPQVFVEKFVENARHVEVQILGDLHGNIMHLWERDCSLQRNNQKVIEEAPAPNLSQSTREALCDSAERLGRAAAYSSAGTVEFLVENGENYYFMEVNSRLQVEHPVTELTLNIDLVELQIRIAEGASLSDLLPTRPKQRGAAIECRICAESPEQGFISGLGRLLQYQLAPATGEGSHIRVDSGFQVNDIVTHYYDSMLAKLVVHADTRERAIAVSIAALSQSKICGVSSNLQYLLKLLRSDAFRAAKHHVALAGPLAAKDKFALASAVSALALLASSLGDGCYRDWNWRITGSAPLARRFLIFGLELNISLERINKLQFSAQASSTDGTQTMRLLLAPDSVYIGAGNFPVIITADGLPENITAANPVQISLLPAGDGIWVSTSFGCFELREVRGLRRDRSSASGPKKHLVTSPLPGKVIALNAQIGQQVEAGEPIGALESMKMEHSIVAPHASKLVKIHVKIGDFVAAGANLFELSYE